MVFKTAILEGYGSVVLTSIESVNVAINKKNLVSVPLCAVKNYLYRQVRGVKNKI